MRKECVVSLESHSVEACQVLRPCTLEEDMLIRLECAWGLRYGTLDSSSEANTMYLTPEFRRMFESGLWALLPMDVPLLKRIANTEFTIEEPIETAYEGRDLFEYVFVPLPGMEGTITRRDDGDPSSETVLPQQHFFPYTTLPVLHLHVQPHYVVVDLYQKIMKHEIFIRSIDKDKGYESYLRKYLRADVNCRGTYLLWKGWDVPPDFIGNPGTDHGGEAQTMFIGREQRLKLRPGAFAWDVDEVGLQPTDSVTYILDREDGEDSSDDDAEEYIVDEANSVFQTRMCQWVAELQPGLTPPDSQSTGVDTMEVDILGVMKDEPDMDTGSPTMVGSVSLSVKKMDCIGEYPTHDTDVPHQTESISDMSPSSESARAII